MSDFYKCEHGSMVCGSCVRGLKIQYNELEAKIAASERRLAIYKEALEKIIKYDDKFCLEIAKTALADGSGK